MNILLLAPKYTRGGTLLPDLRHAMGERIAEAGHRPVVLEDEPDNPGETLRHKFLRLASECQQAVLVWPPDAAMATTADELVLLQEVFDAAKIRIVLVLHNGEVEERGHELHVHFPQDQSRYLDGILTCQPFILWWPRDTSFERLVDRYVDEYL